MITAYLYSTERPLYLKLLTALLLISFISFFISIIYYGVNKYNSMLLIFPVGFVFIYSFLNIKVDVIGEICFNKNSIYLNYYESNTKEFNFKYINKLIIEYRGYKGRNDSSIFNPFLVNGGLNNEIIIYENDGHKLEIDFYIDNPNTMKNIIRMWSEVSELKIEIIESNSRKRIFKNF